MKTLSLKLPDEMVKVLEDRARSRGTTKSEILREALACLVRLTEIAAIGLLGKILGPIGLAVLILQGQWPRATIVLCLTNDLIWWVPFSLYLKDAWPFFRRELV
jgi:hypothetical protein